MPKKVTLACLFAAVGVLVLTASTFAVNVRNGFLRFDDLEYVVQNKAIENGLTPRMICWAFRPTGYASNWHPLTWMSHAFDTTLAHGFGVEWRVSADESGLVECAGIEPYSRFVHGENVLIHAVNAFLLWVLLMVMFFDWKDRFSGTSLAAVFVNAIVALIWALHPLRVEVVAWASERKELLSVFFLLSSLVIYVWNERYGRGVEGMEIPNDPDIAPFVRGLKFVARHARTMVFSLFCCAVLAKPVAVSLPAIIFTHDWLLSRRTFRDSVSRVASCGVLTLIVCYMTMIAQRDARAMEMYFDPLTRLLGIVESPIIYLQQTFWPFGLSLDYPFPDAGTWPAFAAGCLLLLFLVVLAFIVVCKRLRRPEMPRSDPRDCSLVDFLAFTSVWMYIGLLPMIGIVRVGYEPHSDRYTYWIGCGAAVFAAGVAMRLLPRILRRRRFWLCAAAACLACLGALSVRRSLAWYDTETLFADAVEKYHGELFAQWLGEVLEQKGDEGVAEAENLLRRILEIKGTASARAALALHLAIFKSDEADALKESRRLAEQSVNDLKASKWAYAALGFADRHDGLARSAYANMKKAYDLGYVIRVVKDDFDDWKWAASRDAEKESHVQR